MNCAEVFKQVFSGTPLNFGRSFPMTEHQNRFADSTRHCKFTHGMMREAAMPKCFSPSKVKEHECAPITASLRVSVTKFMR